MRSRRPKRLSAFDYSGFHRYFITCCTKNRQRLFLDKSIIDLLRVEFHRTADDYGVVIYAEVFMPDHLHMLLQGDQVDAEFVDFMKIARMRTAFRFRQLTGLRLWQDGYYERVLRTDEDTPAVIAYMIANPVRAGLVKDVNEYPFTFLQANLGRASDAFWRT